MSDKPSFPIIKGLQQRLHSEVVDWPALWAIVDGFDDIPRVRGGLVERTVTPTLAFRMRYNEDGSINHTLKEIAEHFSVTSNAVRHHIEKGIRRLNHPGRRVDWGVLPPDIAKKWREINSQNKTVIPFELSAALELFSPDDPSRPYPLTGILSLECRHQDHIESKEKQMNEPTDQTIAPFEVWGILELMGHVKWLGISDATKVQTTSARRKIILPRFVGRSSTEICRIQTDESETVGLSYITERHDLIQVGDYLCYYQQDSDTLYVRR